MQNQARMIINRPATPFMVPPPMMFGLAFAVGAGLEHLLPLGMMHAPDWLRASGAILLAAGILFGASLAIAFLRRRTTLNPFASPSALMTAGPYRLSRNPMYLSLVVAYLGGTVLLASPWPFLTLLIPMGILDRVVIPYEEALMRGVFGKEYDAYRARVRRWL